jgi:cytochrome c-type biogenesis protein CcmH/NrfG
MAVISLRSYNHEIEGMIDNGQLDEAVAHCRHILATFPKHIASYRLLGKAHLEQQRISDATDIFQRVLTAIPDDFISNVGMSIIREDENNLDAAIWHMEMAYEAQPANIAIQDELRRLYGRRDGTQPPKVRLTRGALARMYAKGGLFDQAIAELRAAISEDPNRPDLQVLLAQMFYQTSQRVEAVETCVKVLKKLPLCLEANRILAVSLPETEGSDAVKNYRQIVISMDPYYAFAESDAISSEQVPENAVNIERLEWKSGIQIGETPNQPTWATSLGISIDKPVDEKIPDWLKSAEAPAPGSTNEKAAPNVSPFIWDTQEVEKIITDTSKPEGDIPDWMKDAGWKPATGEATSPLEETKPPESSADDSTSDDLEQANIPEWLSGIAPEGVLGEEKQDLQPKEDDITNPWLEPHQPGPTDSIIQWLDEKKPVAPATPPPQEENLAMLPEDEIPDWLKDIDLPQTSATQEGIPSKSAPAFTSEASAFTEETVIPESVEAEPEAISMEGSAGPIVEAPSEQAEAILPPAVSETKKASAVFADDIPDWLKEIANELPAAEAFISSGEGSTTEAPQIPEPDLLTEQPLVSEGAPIEEPPTAVEESLIQNLSETAEALPESEIPPITDELPTVEVAPIAEEVPTTELAEASEGLLEVEMPEITEAIPAAEVEEISEEMPTTELPIPSDTIPEAEIPAVAEELPTTEMKSISEEILSTELPVTEGQSPDQLLPEMTEALSEAEIPVISEELHPAEGTFISDEIPAIELPVSAEELPTAEIPAIKAELPQVEPPLPGKGDVVPSETIPSGESEDLSWLEGLVAEQAANKDELITPSPDGEITPPEWVRLESEPTMEAAERLEPLAGEETPAVPADEIPEWIKGLGEEPEIEPVSEVPVPSVPPDIEIPQAEELPAWLQELEQPEPPNEIPVASEEALEWKSEELPAWLKEITESVESEEIIPAVEEPHADEILNELVDVTSEQTVEVVPPLEISGQALEGPQPETGPWVPEVEEPVQPVSTGPIDVEAEPVPVMEEITTKAAEIAPATPPEQAAMPVAMVTEVEKATLTDAREAINQGQPSQAAGFYSKLIKQDYHLGEIIKDLQDALYRFPVDVDMWVTLGDAQYRSDDLQEALNAYTKAEELVR